MFEDVRLTDIVPAEQKVLAHYGFSGDAPRRER